MLRRLLFSYKLTVGRVGASKIAQRIRNDLLILASAEDAGIGLNGERHQIETAVVDGRPSSE